MCSFLLACVCELTGWLYARTNGKSKLQRSLLWNHGTYRGVADKIWSDCGVVWTARAPSNGSTGRKQVSVESSGKRPVSPKAWNICLMSCRLCFFVSRIWQYSCRCKSDIGSHTHTHTHTHTNDFHNPFLPFPQRDAISTWHLLSYRQTKRNCRKNNKNIRWWLQDRVSPSCQVLGSRKLPPTILIKRRPKCEEKRQIDNSLLRLNNNNNKWKSNIRLIE